MSIKITLPIYWNRTKTNQELVSMNKFRNYHYTMQNKIKKDFDLLARAELLKCDRIKISGEYKIKYILFYKNSGSDLMNVVALIDKFLQDTLQKMSITENDNVRFCKYVVAAVGGKDKENPRVEIEVEAVKNGR